VNAPHNEEVAIHFVPDFISKPSVSWLLRLVKPVHCLRLRALTHMIWKWN